MNRRFNFIVCKPEQNDVNYRGHGKVEQGGEIKNTHGWGGKADSFRMKSNEKQRAVRRRALSVIYEFFIFMRTKSA
jgi:hypothetical protein